ncbi:MAG: hypothetical protein O3B64_01980 [bacterium]|nr:hypothetical protein [bacterium]
MVKRERTMIVIGSVSFILLLSFLAIGGVVAFAFRVSGAEFEAPDIQLFHEARQAAQPELDAFKKQYEAYSAFTNDVIDDDTLTQEAEAVIAEKMKEAITTQYGEKEGNES